MIARCENPRNKRYADWGGRGIKVCERWHEFANFLADMGEKPDELSIDRIDNSGNYEPGNCRWATRKEQNNNRRRIRTRGPDSRSRFFELNGERMILADWARRTGVPASTILVRLSRGWSVERALSTPVGG